MPARVTLNVCLQRRVVSLGPQLRCTWPLSGDRSLLALSTLSDSLNAPIHRDILAQVRRSKRRAHTNGVATKKPVLKLSLKAGLRWILAGSVATTVVLIVMCRLSGSTVSVPEVMPAGVKLPVSHDIVNHSNAHTIAHCYDRPTETSGVGAASVMGSWPSAFTQECTSPAVVAETGGARVLSSLSDAFASVASTCSSEVLRMGLLAAFLQQQVPLVAVMAIALPLINAQPAVEAPGASCDDVGDHWVASLTAEHGLRISGCLELQQRGLCEDVAARGLCPNTCLLCGANCSDTKAHTVAKVAAGYGQQLADCHEMQAQGLCSHPAARGLCPATCALCGVVPLRQHRELQTQKPSPPSPLPPPQTPPAPPLQPLPPLAPSFTYVTSPGHLIAAVANLSADDAVFLSLIPNRRYAMGGRSIVLTQGRLVIRGSPSQNAILDGENAARVFDVQGGSLALEYITIMGGRISSSGGGISISGSSTVVTITSTILHDNTAVAVSAHCMNLP